MLLSDTRHMFHACAAPVKQRCVSEKQPLGSKAGNTTTVCMMLLTFGFPQQVRLILTDSSRDLRFWRGENI